MEKRTKKAAPALGRPMPQDAGLEGVVLGAIIVDSTAFFTLQTSTFALNSSDFFNASHNKTWAVIAELAASNSPIDLLTVSNGLRKAGYLEAVGGALYLVDLTSRVASSANIEYHAAILKQITIRRSIIEQASAALEGAYEPTADPLETLDTVQRGLADISNGWGKSAINPANLVDETYQKFVNPNLLQRPVITGYPTLDRALSGGIYSDDFVSLLGGRPGSGKTALALGLMLEKVKQGKPVAFFSYEMPAQTLMMRLYSAFTGLHAANLRNQCLESWEIEHLQNARNWFAQRAHLLHIFEAEGMPLGLLLAKMSKAKMDGISDIYIDHFGEIPNPEKANEELGNAVKIRSIRDLSKSLQLRTTILVQLRKPSNGAVVLKPTLSDIKGSSAISECAANIFLLHEEEGRRIVIIDKCRNSGVNEIDLNYIGECYQWQDPEGQADGDLFALPPVPRFSEKSNTISDNLDFDYSEWS